MQDDFDPAVQAERKKQRTLELREERRHEASELELLMSEAWGRKHVYTLLSEAGVFHSGFSPDPYIHAFNAGQRNVGLKWMTRLAVFPDLYAQMMKENSDAS